MTPSSRCPFQVHPAILSGTPYFKPIQKQNSAQSNKSKRVTTLTDLSIEIAFGTDPSLYKWVVRQLTQLNDTPIEWA